MPPSKEEQIYLVSLALEKALLCEDWTEADALFESRAALIGSLPETEVDRTTMDKIRRHEASLLHSLTTIRGSLGQELGDLSRAQSAVKTYRSSANG